MVHRNALDFRVYVETNILFRDSKTGPSIGGNRCRCRVFSARRGEPFFFPPSCKFYIIPLLQLLLLAQVKFHETYVCIYTCTRKTGTSSISSFPADIFLVLRLFKRIENEIRREIMFHV